MAESSTELRNMLPCKAFRWPSRWAHIILWPQLSWTVSTGPSPTAPRLDVVARGPLAAVVAVCLALAAGCADRPVAHQNSTPKLPLRPVGEIPLPGDSSRFDYASLDSGRGLLFIAPLGASE